jgi:hypothetical protein
LTLLDTWHPNVLITGPAEATAAALAALRGILRSPVVHWQAGTSLTVPLTVPARTLILNDVAALNAADQARLHQWMQRPGHETQVVATSAMPLLLLVDGGQFDAALYYALNVIYLEVAARPTVPGFVGSKPD